MGFKVQVSESDKWELILLDEPSYIHALKIAPEAMEPELGLGTWLVVAFPVWSAHVRHSIQAAVSCAKLYAGRFHLGIRPFDSFDEISNWWPSASLPEVGETIVTDVSEGQRPGLYITTDSNAIPAWLILKDGQVVYQGAGTRSVEQLGDLVKKVLQ